MNRAAAIGKRIWAWRKQFGISQRAFAKEIMTSQVVVSHWGNGVNTPNAYTIARICRFTGLTADYLLGVEETYDDDYKHR